MTVTKEQFKKDILRLQYERKQKIYETKQAADRIREHGVRSVTHGRCRGWGC